MNKSQILSVPLKSTVRVRGKARTIRPIWWASLQNAEQFTTKEQRGPLWLVLDDGKEIEIEFPDMALSGIILLQENRKNFGLFLGRSRFYSLLNMFILPLRWSILRGAFLETGEEIEVIGEVSRVRFSDAEKLSREAAEFEVDAIQAKLISTRKEQ